MSAPVRIAELAAILHQRSSRWRAMAMLRAYFDETGTHEASAVTAIGGYVAIEPVWTEVEDEWIPVLAEVASKGVTHFHLCDCLMNSGEFALCDEPTRNYLLTQFSNILGRHKLIPIFSAVVQDDWDELNDGGPFFQAFPTPVALCFENLVRELALWAKQYAGGERVAPMFAYRQEWASGLGLGAPILQLYGSQPWYRQILAPIAFGFPQDCIPLQAADLFAGLVRRDIEARSGGEAVGRTQALHWATNGRFMHGSWFDRAVLQLAIERFERAGEIYPC